MYNSPLEEFLAPSRMRSYTVALSEEEYEQVVEIGIRRAENGRAYRDTRPDLRRYITSEEANIQGALGEAAFCNGESALWVGRDRQVPGGIDAWAYGQEVEVRTTRMGRRQQRCGCPSRFLTVKSTDSKDTALVLVSRTSDPWVFRILGWTTAKIGRLLGEKHHSEFHLVERKLFPMDKFTGNVLLLLNSVEIVKSEGVILEEGIPVNEAS